MKKSIILCAALLAMVSCKNNEAEVKPENAATEDTAATVNSNVSENEAATEAEEQKEVVNEEVKPETLQPVTDQEYVSFGASITPYKALSKEQMLKKYNGLKSGDTLNVKFTTKIKDVCQKKGCWMSLELPGGKESFVKFKDYAFFVPLNAGGQEAIVSGKAFVSETSVEQLRHYAKDGGKSEAEIAKITQPEIEYKFLADGVLISK